jgi:hypothetical protein
MERATARVWLEGTRWVTQVEIDGVPCERRRATRELLEPVDQDVRAHAPTSQLLAGAR